MGVFDTIAEAVAARMEAQKRLASLEHIEATGHRMRITVYPLKVMRISVINADNDPNVALRKE